MTAVDFNRQFSIYDDEDKIRTLVNAIYHELSLRENLSKDITDIFIERACREVVTAMFLYVFETESPINRSI